MSAQRAAAGAYPRYRSEATKEFAGAVGYYLRLLPRQLPSRYLYDPLGSALFDAICQLPWYRITRAEAALLAAHRHELFNCLDRVSTVVELGSGSGEKLRLLAEAGLRHSGRLTVHLIDISASALVASARALGDLNTVEIVAHEAPYEAGLVEFGRKRPAGATLALFLGSNIGNFDRPGADAILASIRAALRDRDVLLLGADLVKPERDLLLAYDDPLGITAAFNRNLLVRINRELGGNFDIEAFVHRAAWNATESRVEMHLVARRSQEVRIAAADLAIDLAAGEAIWTESSYKYQPEEIVDLVEPAGFRCVRQWIDDVDQFALTLFQAV